MSKCLGQCDCTPTEIAKAFEEALAAMNAKLDAEMKYAAKFAKVRHLIALHAASGLNTGKETP